MKTNNLLILIIVSCITLCHSVRGSLSLGCRPRHEGGSYSFPVDQDHADTLPLPIFKKRKTDKKSAISISDVKKYLLTHDCSSEGEDPVKLQNLLCSCQDYSEAIFGQPLFTEEPVLYKHEAVNGSGYKLSNGQTNTTKKNGVPMSSDDHLQEDDETHIKVILALKKASSEVQHTDHHEEFPAMQTKTEAPITSGLREKYFSTPEHWSEYVVQCLLQEQNYNRRCQWIQYAREYISYSYLSSVEELREFKGRFEKLCEPLAQQLSSWKCVEQIRWPHQSALQAFLGHLFFPVQLEYLYETSLRLRLREPIQFLLALSASYGHPLAQYHIARVLVLYDPTYENKIDAVQKYFGDEVKKQHETYCKTPSSKRNVPRYLCGLLCIRYNKFRRAQGHFKRGFNAGDPWCGYRYAWDLANKEKRKVQLEKLLPMHEGLGSMLATRFEDDKQKRIDLFVQAGNEGIAEGYNSAGVIAQSLNQFQAYGYYLQAAQHHILGAYEEVAEYRTKEGKPDQAGQLYSIMAEHGDAQGSILLSELLAKEGRRKEAKFAFKSAGVLGYDKRISLIQNSKKEKRLQKKRDRYAQTHIAILLELAGFPR